MKHATFGGSVVHEQENPIPDDFLDGHNNARSQQAALEEGHQASVQTQQLNTVEVMEATVEEFADQVDISGDLFLAEILERIKLLK